MISEKRGKRLTRISAELTDLKRVVVVVKIINCNCDAVTDVDVMVRNLSCPAVSHICSLTLSPSTSTVRIL